MRTVLMVSGSFPDLRCARSAIAYRDAGWRVELLCRRYPCQFVEVYDRIHFWPYHDEADYAATIYDIRPDIAHVHGELLDKWPVFAAKSAGFPVVLDVHDLQLMRAREGVDAVYDLTEAEAIEAADAVVWVTQGQKNAAKRAGIDCSGPHALVPNYPTRRAFVTKSLHRPLGGLVYAGHINPRGTALNDYDMSPVADALGGNLHVQPGNPGCDYGIVHEVEFDYHLYISCLARHDWGFVGYPTKTPVWSVAWPTKLGEYIAAGIPIVMMNCPEARPLVAAGMGVEITHLGDLAKTLERADRPRMRKRVLAMRDRWSIEAIAHHYTELAEGLL